jgi:hypothetical protein
VIDSRIHDIKEVATREHFGERRLGKEVRTTLGMSLTCANTTYPKGYTRRGTKAVMPPPHD